MNRGSARARQRRKRFAARDRERLERLAELYQGVDGGDYLRPPRAIHPDERQAGSRRTGATVTDLGWPSDYQPFMPELAERYRRERENLRGRARLIAHAEPRPAVVIVHGYLTWQYAVEQRVWPVDWLYGLGLDVALFVQPFHAVRAAPGRRGPPPFPSNDPALTNEALRHATGDLVDLTQWLLERGHGAVGLMGMSLGGYVVALAATVAMPWAFVVPLAPLSSLADFIRDQGRLSRDPAKAARTHRLIDTVHRVASPLHRAPAIDGEAMLVLAGQVDLVTPKRHAERLAEHFGAPLALWPGGHLLQLGRRQCFGRFEALLQSRGVLEGPS